MSLGIRKSASRNAPIRDATYHEALAWHGMDFEMSFIHPFVFPGAILSTPRPSRLAITVKLYP